MYNRRLRALQRCAAGFALAAFLVAAAALPAQAHTTGPQLVSHFDGFSPASPGVEYTILSTGSGTRFFRIIGELSLYSGTAPGAS